MKKLLFVLLIAMNTTVTASDLGLYWGIPVRYPSTWHCSNCTQMSRKWDDAPPITFYRHAVAKECEKEHVTCESRRYVRNQALTKTLPAMTVIGGGSAAYIYAPQIKNVVKGIGTTVTTKLKDVDWQGLKSQTKEIASQAWQESIKPELLDKWNSANSIAAPVLSHPATPVLVTAGFIGASAYIGNKILNKNIHHNSSPNRHTFDTCPHLLSCRTKLAGCTSLVGIGTALGTAWTLKNLDHDLSSTPVALGIAATGAVVGGGMYHWLNMKEANARVSFKSIGLFRELGVLARMPLGIWQHWNKNNTGN